MSGVGSSKGIRKKSRRKWQWSPLKIEELGLVIGTEDSGQCSAPVAQLEFGLRERTKRIVGREIQSEREEEKKLGFIFYFFYL